MILKNKKTMSVNFLKKINGNNNGHFSKFLKNYKTNINEPNISWYCSAGEDFRNLIYLSKEYVIKNVSKKESNEWIKPDLYIFYLKYYLGLDIKNMDEINYIYKWSYEYLKYNLKKSDKIIL
mgnify:CR=1 FL=1